MKIRNLATVSILAAGFALAACSGGGGGSEGSSTNVPVPDTTTKDTTPGVWKGTISSATTGQTASVVALTGHDGHTVWMATDGRVWHGQVPLHGDRFDATLTGHMYEGAQFPDGTNHGTFDMAIEHHSASTTSGHHTGSGDAGAFNMAMSPMWERAASLSTVAGVFTRTTSNGYAMTMAIDTHGQVTGSDSKGCVFNGTVTVPDSQHNMYDVDVDVSSCGTLDGHYAGMGALLDADAMQDWMTAMHPLEHGGHSHGGPMMGGEHVGHNTVPTGHHNLFVFSMVNDHNAIMDALTR
jgi:hypothetical protein